VGDETVAISAKTLGVRAWLKSAGKRGRVLSCPTTWPASSICATAAVPPLCA